MALIGFMKMSWNLELLCDLNSTHTFNCKFHYIKITDDHSGWQQHTCHDRGIWLNKTVVMVAYFIYFLVDVSKDFSTVKFLYFILNFAEIYILGWNILVSYPKVCQNLYFRMKYSSVLS